MNRELDTSYSVIHVRFAHYQFITQTLGPNQANEYIKKQVDRLKTIFADENTFFGRLSENVVAIFNAAKNISKLADQASMYQSVYLPLKEAITIDGESFEGNLSIGINTGRARERKPQALLANASFAAQTALDNDVGLAFYDPERHRENIEKFHLEPKLRDALKARELILYYQPIVNTQSGNIESFEALIRWPQSDGSMIPPFKFITLAEETGLIYDIDSFVLDETCRQISLWRDKYGPEKKFTIGANISAKHWVNPALVQEVQDIIQKYNIPSNYLKLEMTESAMVDNAEAVQTNVHKLKDLGVKIALDDFGTGYSSLGYLIDFPVDILKVDKIFVDDMHQDEKKKQLVTHILNIAQSLNMTTIVEGVELEEQHNELKQLNCHQIQGYYFFKPLPVSDVEQYFG
jgi:EAL domain-containing protein (putative c-di-GMP-specific phosphodiesterase class I)/GGDEF domain-containing protein